MLAFGGLSGLIAQTVTYPLDVIRRKMQVQGVLQLHGDEKGPPPTKPDKRSSTTVATASTTTDATRANAATAATSEAIAAARPTAHTTSAPAAAAGGEGSSRAGAGSGARVERELGGGRSIGSSELKQQRQHSSSSNGSSSSSSPGRQVSLSRQTGLRAAASSEGSLAHLASLDCVRPQNQGSGLATSSSCSRAHHWLRVQQRPPIAGRLTIAETTRQIIQQGGWIGLFRGLSINYVKVVPSTAIGFTLYDALKSYLDLSSNL